MVTSRGSASTSPPVPVGVVPFDRLGVVHLPGVGDLDVWWLASYGGGVLACRSRTRTTATTTW